jgi:D-alanyl-D-alanine carboxypeptidase/D-alanyl-D-alanine-endopeptidase (penicillin-binding protein 4)
MLVAWFTFLVLASFEEIACAQNALKDRLTGVINSDSLSKTAVVAVSVRDASTGTLIFSRQGQYFLHTASTLKALTMPVVLQTLGKSYNVETTLLKTPEDKYFLKLSGDPLLKTDDLIKLFKEAKSRGVLTINGELIIDDSAIDEIPWGVGWMWDDENNPLMPKYSVYNLDYNVITVKVSPGRLNQPPVITVVPDYGIRIVNLAKTGNQNDFSIERRPWLDPEAIYIEGIFNTAVSKKIPVGIPKNYFISRLKYAIKIAGIEFSEGIKHGSVSQQATTIAKVSRKILDEIGFVNQKSNNTGAETLFKLAGGRYSKLEGSTKNGLKAMKNFYKTIGADCSSQEIVDASGASHNNLIQPDWMTLALSKLYQWPLFSEYKKTLAQPGQEGTLKYRHQDLSGRLYAKTGTLAGISGFTGYLKANSGKTYAFSILIQNYKGSSLPAKNLESKIINTIRHY